MKNKEMTTRGYNNLIVRIAEILKEARSKVVREINKAQVLAYWEIGREIIEFEQKGKARAEYGEALLKKISIDLTTKFGKGFSVDNLQLMRRFYLTYSDKFQIYETVSRKSQKAATTSTESLIRQTQSDETQKSLILSAESSKVRKSETVCRKSLIDQTPSVLSAISAQASKFEPILL